MMRLFFLGALLALAQCSKAPLSKVEPLKGAIESENKVFSVTPTWLTGPVARNYSSVRLSLSAAEGVVATTDEITIDPQMPAHGHGTSTDDQVITIESSQSVRVEGIYFVMGGAWVIHLSAKVNGKTDTALIPVEVP
ncbi:MAG: hypothetical protein HYZ71_14505 [Deltaproteobacteria bacterium]|nr:hypothetical protein [Deltaproteobacteria bacterium]